MNKYDTLNHKGKLFSIYSIPNTSAWFTEIHQLFSLVIECYYNDIDLIDFNKIEEYEFYLNDILMKNNGFRYFKDDVFNKRFDPVRLINKFIKDYNNGIPYLYHTNISSLLVKSCFDDKNNIKPNLLNIIRYDDLISVAILFTYALMYKYFDYKKFSNELQNVLKNHEELSSNVYFINVSNETLALRLILGVIQISIINKVIMYLYSLSTIGEVQKDLLSTPFYHNVGKLVITRNKDFVEQISPTISMINTGHYNTITPMVGIFNFINESLDFNNNENIITKIYQNNSKDYIKCIKKLFYSNINYNDLMNSLINGVLVSIDQEYARILIPLLPNECSVRYGIEDATFFNIYNFHVSESLINSNLEDKVEEQIILN